MNKYLVYFDCNGFESIINITAHETEQIMATLRGEEYRLPFNFNNMMFRARYNPQRSPEIWVFNADDEVDEESVWELANSNPQYLADFARENGTNLFGQKSSIKQRIV